MRGSWWHCACGSLPVLFFSSHASSCLSSNPLPANPFHQSIQPACLGGCCSLAIDALIAVGHIEKIVLLVVILPGDKGTKWGAKAGNSLHVRKAQARDHCNMSRQLLFCCSSPFTSKTLLPKTKENSGHSSASTYRQGIYTSQEMYLKSHSQAVLQACNRNSSDSSPVSQYGMVLRSRERLGRI